MSKEKFWDRLVIKPPVRPGGRAPSDEQYDLGVRVQQAAQALQSGGCPEAKTAEIVKIRRRDWANWVARALGTPTVAASYNPNLDRGEVLVEQATSTEGWRKRTLWPGTEVQAYFLDLIRQKNGELREDYVIISPRLIHIAPRIASIALRLPSEHPTFDSREIIPVFRLWTVDDYFGSFDPDAVKAFEDRATQLLEQAAPPDQQQDL